MAENAEETTPTADEAQTPPRRRASRRVTAAAGTVAAPAETDADTASPGAAEPAATEPAAEAPKKRTTRSRKKPAEPETAPTEADSSATESATTAAADAGATETPAEAAEAPKKRATRSRKKPAEAPAAPADAAPADGAGEATTAESDAAAAESSEKTEAAPTRRRSTRKTAAQTAKESAEQAPADSAESAATETASSQAETKATDDADASSTADGSESATATQERGEAAPQRGRGRRTRGKAADASNDAKDDSAENAADETSSDDSSSRGRGRGRGNGRGQDTNKQDANKQDSNKSENGDNDRGGRGDANRGDQQSRSSRTRQRDRKRRGQGDDFEQEISDDDVLLPIAGILDVLDNYAFVRTSGYLPGPSDVYVSLGQVKKYGLRKGDAVVGAIRQPRDNDGGGRQKYNAIVKVDTVNSRTTEENQSRSAFDELTPLYPQERLQLETSADSFAARIIDLVAPIGKGQRGLIIGERGTGKSSILRAIAASVSVHAPDAHLMTVVLDERPEEVTELQRTIKGEVVASTFDQSAEDHTTVAELSIERAKRLVELGHDVVVLLDSITVLGRAYAQRPVQGRAASTAVDATVLQPVKGLLGAARNIENGGSLTIIATALEKTGSRTDKVILREIAGTANSEVRLSRELADDQLAPAIDVTKSYTVRAEHLLPDTEVRATQKLRAGFATKDSGEALSDLLAQISSSTTNAALLAQVMRG